MQNLIVVASTLIYLLLIGLGAWKPDAITVNHNRLKSRWAGALAMGILVPVVALVLFVLAEVVSVVTKFFLLPYLTIFGIWPF